MTPCADVLAGGPVGAPLTETEPSAFRSDTSARRAHLWRAAWRWHFYAAAIVLPVLFVLALSGLALLLKPTLERTFYGDRLSVSPSGAKALPIDRQADAVSGAYPGSAITAVVPPRHERRSTQFDIKLSNGRPISVYVDPYTSEVLGSIDSRSRINNVATSIHGSLFAGKAGDWLVEVAGGWTLVMVATGVFLWWPRRDKGQTFRRAFRIRFTVPGRKRWRDLHSVPGAVFAVFIAFLVVTGLPWSAFWGDRWGRFVDWVGSGSTVPAAPTSDLNAAGTGTDGHTVAWAQQRTPVPRPQTPPSEPGPGPGEQPHHGGAGASPGVDARPPRTPIGFEAAARIGAERGMRPGFAIAAPDGGTGVYTLSNSWPQPARNARTVFVDQYSAAVLGDYGWRGEGALSKATSWGIITHMGRQYGPANAVVMGSACLAVIGAVVTAPVMWWKRRPSGRLGTPRRPTGARIPRRALVVAGVLAVLYPLLGVSMLAVAAFDRFVVRRVGTLRRAFGMP